MNDIRIRDHEQGIRLKEDSIKAFDAADDLMNAAHHAYIKGKGSVEKKDDEKPEDQVVETLRDGKDTAAGATERYIKKVLKEDDELLKNEGTGSVPSDSVQVDYFYPESRKEPDLFSQNKEKSDVVNVLPEEQGVDTASASAASADYYLHGTGMRSDQSHSSIVTNLSSQSDKSVPDSYHVIKTRETSSIKEYHPSIKYADKSIKTADTAGKAIKTEQAAEAEETTRKSAQAAGTASRTAARQSANAAGQAAASESANAAASSAANSAASSAAAASAESAAASNWIVWVVIAFVILIMVLATNFLGSILTYRMTGNDEDIAIRDVISEINTEFQASIDELRNRRDYDDIVMEGSRPKWRNVLAVYFAKNTDGDDPPDTDSFFYVSERGKEKLKKIYKDMVEIDAEESTYTETELVRLDETDEYGHEVYELQEVEKTRLTITVTPKSAYEMAEQRFYMNNRQKEILYDLLSEEYDDIWPILVYGYFPEDAPIVEVALQEIGNIGGEKYWRWYGFGSHVDWCACFVSWCADECGYISAGKIPKYARCANGVQWFQEHGQWLPADIEPAPGMIIFFDWNHPDGQSGPQDGHADHTGIVERVEDGIIYTVEGNAWDVCMQNQYPVGWYEILGYGTYDMAEESGPQNGVADHTGIVERVEAGFVYTIEGNAWDVVMENQYTIISL